MNNGFSLFSIINPGFFGILAGKNKQNNFCLLVETERVFGSSLTILRSRLVDSLSDYIKVMHFDKVGEIDEDFEEKDYLLEESQVDNAQSKASSFVRSLERRGWLELEQDDNLDLIVSRTDAYIAIFNALYNLIEEETNAKEYATPLLSLFKFVDQFDYQNATLSIQGIENASDELGKALLSINSRIKRFVNKTMAEQSLTEKEILHKLTYEYQKFTAYIAFHNLITKNNPNKYLNVILNKLDVLKEVDKLEQIVINYLEVKKLENNPDNFIAGKKYILSVLDKVENQMLNINDSLTLISQRNNLYVRNSSNRIKFRLNNEYDIKGEINKVLKLMKYSENEDEYFSPFNIYNYNQIDHKSLYTARALSKIAPKKVPFVKREVSEEALLKAKMLTEEIEKYSVKAVNEFVLKFLKDKTQIEVKDLEVSDMEEFIKFLLIPSYSSHGESMFYISKPLDKKVTLFGYQVDNYIIYLKENR